MSDCRLFLVGPDYWLCRDCCEPVFSRTMPRRNCLATITERTQAEQDALISICATCEHFAVVACKKCGCSSGRAEVWQSKLRVGHCPMGKW